jgi:hypothetical protein
MQASPGVQLGGDCAPAGRLGSKTEQTNTQTVDQFAPTRVVGSNCVMTDPKECRDQRRQKIIRAKVGLLELAKQLGNVGSIVLAGGQRVGAHQIFRG